MKRDEKINLKKSFFPCSNFFGFGSLNHSDNSQNFDKVIFVSMTSPSLQLVHAIFANDSSKIRVLVEKGEVNVNDKGFFILPPLLRAALYGKADALKALLEFGADKNIRDSQGRTALELAQKYNHPKIVEILLQQG